MKLITETKELAELCAALADEAFVTVDTEFMRESTYWPILCLIQIAGETQTGLIDPLAKGLDLKPFYELMANPRVVKVFHAARQDVEIMVHEAGVVPNPMFDTQVAAMVAGFGDQVGYEAIARKLAKAQIDKSSRFTDWSRRPLSEKQLAYALSDVTHLRTVYKALKVELDKTGREPWLQQEMDILTDPDTYSVKPADAWERIKVRLKSKKQLAVLIALAAWREREAQDRNVPRARVIKDDSLAELAIQMPESKEALEQLRALPRGTANSKQADSILKAVAEGLKADQASLPPLPGHHERSSDDAQAATEILKLALKIISEAEGIAPKLVASAADVEGLARGEREASPLLQGWRRTVFGNRAIDLIEGRAMIGFQNGRAVIVSSVL